MTKHKQTRRRMSFGSIAPLLLLLLQVQGTSQVRRRTLVIKEKESEASLPMKASQNDEHNVNSRAVASDDTRWNGQQNQPAGRHSTIREKRQAPRLTKRLSMGRRRADRSLSAAAGRQRKLPYDYSGFISQLTGKGKGGNVFAGGNGTKGGYSDGPSSKGSGKGGAKVGGKGGSKSATSGGTSSKAGYQSSKGKGGKGGKGDYYYDNVISTSPSTEPSQVPSQFPSTGPSKWVEGSTESTDESDEAEQPSSRLEDLSSDMLDASEVETSGTSDGVDATAPTYSPSTGSPSATVSPSETMSMDATNATGTMDPTSGPTTTPLQAPTPAPKIFEEIQEARFAPPGFDPSAFFESPFSNSQASHSAVAKTTSTSTAATRSHEWTQLAKLEQLAQTNTRSIAMITSSTPKGDRHGGSNEAQTILPKMGRQAIAPCELNANGFYGQPIGTVFEVFYTYQAILMDDVTLLQLQTEVTPVLDFEIANNILPYFFECSVTETVVADDEDANATATDPPAAGDQPPPDFPPNDDIPPPAVEEASESSSSQSSTTTLWQQEGVGIGETSFTRHNDGGNRKLQGELPDPTIEGVSRLQTDVAITSGPVSCVGSASTTNCYVFAGSINVFAINVALEQQVQDLVRPAIQRVMQGTALENVSPLVLDVQYLNDGLETVAPLPTVAPPTGTSAPTTTAAPATGQPTGPSTTTPTGTEVPTAPTAPIPPIGPPTGSLAPSINPAGPTPTTSDPAGSPSAVTTTPTVVPVPATPAPAPAPSGTPQAGSAEVTWWQWVLVVVGILLVILCGCAVFRGVGNSGDGGGNRLQSPTADDTYVPPGGSGAAVDTYTPPDTAVDTYQSSSVDDYVPPGGSGANFDNLGTVEEDDSDEDSEEEDEEEDDEYYDEEEEEDDEEEASEEEEDENGEYVDEYEQDGYQEGGYQPEYNVEGGNYYDDAENNVDYEGGDYYDQDEEEGDEEEEYEDGEENEEEEDEEGDEYEEGEEEYEDEEGEYEDGDEEGEYVEEGEYEMDYGDEEEYEEEEQSYYEEETLEQADQVQYGQPPQQGNWGNQASYGGASY